MHYQSQRQENLCIVLSDTIVSDDCFVYRWHNLSVTRFGPIQGLGQGPLTLSKSATLWSDWTLSFSISPGSCFSCRRQHCLRVYYRGVKVLQHSFWFAHPPSTCLLLFPRGTLRCAEMTELSAWQFQLTAHQNKKPSLLNYGRLKGQLIQAGNSQREPRNLLFYAWN